MSFKFFIYYCALCGGWAAFLVWALVQGAGLRTLTPLWLRAALIGALIGTFVAGAVGLVDALLNAVGTQRLLRVLVCMGLGLLAGLFGGLVGQGLYALLLNVLPAAVQWVPVSFGWVLAGVLIGASIGAFDLLRVVMGQQDLRASLKKVFNGALGGFIGGLIGGVPFGILLAVAPPTLRSGLSTGLVLFGACIGLMIGLAQVILKEAWLTVESGFRAGRELMLTKDETTIGRAEGCDVGLFGDNAIEKLHARIVLKNNRYLLAHAAPDGETFLNDQPVTRPAPLKSGDAIRVGRSVLRFGERQKRR
jgi:hypothetical protein